MSTDFSVADVVKLFEVIKEYWFLITLGISIMATVVYMVLFRVNPWDKYKEISYQRQQVKFHNLIGHDLLERGQFKLAQEEFEKAIAIKGTDFEAMNGSYLSGLFLSLESTDWDPAVGIAVQSQLHLLGVIRQKGLLHVVNKYLGDLHQRIGENSAAQNHYREALSLSPDYPDALHAFAWFLYMADSHPDLKIMENAFRKMTEIDPYDYRGFHGLGYALYMQALRESVADSRKTLVQEAAIQSEKSKDLKIYALNVVADFGEIARSVNPNLAVSFHEWGCRLLDDESLSKLPSVADPLGARLLLSPGLVYIATPDQRRAWMNYQLSLDYLAMHRNSAQGDEDHLEDHQRMLKKARELDSEEQIFPIYQDQLQILNLLAPENGIRTP